MMFSTLLRYLCCRNRDAGSQEIFTSSAPNKYKRKTPFGFFKGVCLGVSGDALLMWKRTLQLVRRSVTFVWWAHVVPARSTASPIIPLRCVHVGVF